MIEYFIIILFILCIICIAIILYYRSLLSKEKNTRKNLEDKIITMENSIKNIQEHLKHSLKNIDLLDDEIKIFKNEIVSLRIKNSKYRIENNRLNLKIKKEEDKYIN